MKISLYPNISTPSLTDTLIGSDSLNGNETKTFTISDILSLTDLSSCFPLVGGTLTGVNGNGFHGFIAQSTKPSTPTSGFRLYADSSDKLSWVGINGFSRTFDGSANTADRAYVLPDVNGSIVLGSGASNTLSFWSGPNSLSTIANSAGLLQNNGTGVFSWVSAITNPMTTLGDMIYGGASGVTSRLAGNTTTGNYFLTQTGTGINSAAPTWMNLFGTANTFTEAQTINKTQASPTYLVVNNPQAGSVSTAMGAGIQMTSNSSNAYLDYNFSNGGAYTDKTLRMYSPTGISLYATGTTGNTNANFYIELGNAAASSVRFLTSASNPRTLMELYSSNAGTSYVEFRLNAGGAPIGLYGKSSMLGIGVSPTSTLHNSGSFGQNLLTKTTSYTLTATDYCIVFTGSTASQTMTLPASTSIAGRIYEIANAGTVSITIATTAETFLNVTGTPATLTLAANAAKSVRVISTGAGWVQLN